MKRIILKILPFLLLVPVNAEPRQSRYDFDLRDYEIERLKRQIKLQQLEAEIIIKEINL